jgi:hypothetical protein
MRLSIRNCRSDRPLSSLVRWEWTAKKLGPRWGLLLIATLVNSPAHSQSPETPLTRLRPIGESSAVDKFAQVNTPELSRRETANQVVTAEWESTPRAAAAVAASRSESGASYAARMQFQLPSGMPTTAPPVGPSSDASVITPPSLSGQSAPTYGSVPPGTMPPGSYVPPPSGPVFGPSPQTVAPPFATGPATGLPPRSLSPTVTPPRGLPMNPGPVPMTPMAVAPPRGDLLPVSPPQLNDQYATIANCSCISPPSGYVAATPWPRPPANRSYPAAPAPPYIANRAPIATVPVIPDASSMPKGSGIPQNSLFNFGQDRNPIVVGRGIVGQPVAYVPGQPVRNSFRYLFP